MRKLKLKNELPPYGISYGSYAIITGVCKTEIQASSGLEGLITDITVFFHIRLSKGAPFPFICSPYNRRPLLGKKRNIRKATF